MDKTRENPSGGLLRQALRSSRPQKPSAFFTSRIMQQVRREALRRERRQERFLLAGLIGGCVLLLGLLAGVLIYLPVDWPAFPQMQAICLYGALTVVLMGMFYVEKRLRSRWKRE